MKQLLENDTQILLYKLVDKRILPPMNKMFTKSKGNKHLSAIHFFTSHIWLSLLNILHENSIIL